MTSKINFLEEFTQLFIKFLNSFFKIKNKKKNASSSYQNRFNSVNL